MSIWNSIQLNELDEVPNDWLFHAINSEAGVICEFWLNGLSLQIRDKLGADRALLDYYRQCFTMAILDPTLKGGYCRSVLSRQTLFLFSLDEEWTCKHIFTLFIDKDKNKFNQSWQGYLYSVRLYPELVQKLVPVFMSAIPRINTDFTGNQDRFIEVYAALAVYHVDDPLQQFLPALFKNGSNENRIEFAVHVGFFLRNMDDQTKKQLWNRWLNRYWSDRLQAIPVDLNENEIQKMLDWLPHLGGLYPEAVLLAICSKPIKIEHSLMLFEIKDSDLAKKYSTETAKLLIYICTCEVGYHISEIAEIDSQLTSIDLKLRHSLDEELARIGIVK